MYALLKDNTTHTTHHTTHTDTQHTTHSAQHTTHTDTQHTTHTTHTDTQHTVIQQIDREQKKISIYKIRLTNIQNKHD